ncbi:hypothetical protein ACFL35_01565 [Candidatus Riflebacteria bacterium]
MKLKTGKLLKQFISPGIFPTVILLLCIFSAELKAETLEDTLLSRARQEKLNNAIRGVLLFLEDSQIRDRKGKRSSFYDSSDEGDGCKSRMRFYIPIAKKGLGLPIPPMLKMRNRTGEWGSFVHFMPKKMGVGGNTFGSVQDSNLFMTAFISYPLFLIKENMDDARRVLPRIHQLAQQNISSFKRGNAYNFWVTQDGYYGKTPRTGPYNIPVNFVHKLAKSYLNPRLEFFWKKFARGLDVPPPDWLEQCADRQNNPTGSDALFNIPNDGDDTSTAVALQYLYAKSKDLHSSNRPISTEKYVDYAALEEIGKFRDLSRDPAKEDGRDAWKGKDSGAFLTWMKDENLHTFARPEEGIIPLGKNNVDIVVNANVLFALALAEKKITGYEETVTLLSKAIKEKRWPEAGLYYPQFMIFPYSVTRAYRDGNIKSPEFKVAMGKLLRDIISCFEENQKRKEGAFPGGEDRSSDLATALGLTSMLNIGEDVAIIEGVEEKYRKIITQSADFLLNNSRKYKIKNKETYSRFGIKKDAKVKGTTWESGLFFAASFWDLANWRSQAFTNSMVLEALLKYRLAYDKGGVSILAGRKLFVQNYFSAEGKLISEVR